MSNRTNLELLGDILESTRRINIYTNGLTYEIFQTDLKTQDAVIRNLEVIGEAVKKISMEFRDQYPSIPWKSMTGVRDRLIHHYFGVDLNIVWNIVVEELSDVVMQITEIVQEHSLSGQLLI